LTTPKSPDERFKDDLEAQYDQVMKVIKNALSSTKKVSTDIQCKDCQKVRRYYVEIPNVRDAMAAAEFLANRGIGRPGTVEPGDRQVVHEYKLEWVRPTDPEVPSARLDV
jgi:hypothetical protein